MQLLWRALKLSRARPFASRILLLCSLIPAFALMFLTSDDTPREYAKVDSTEVIDTLWIANMSNDFNESVSLILNITSAVDEFNFTMNLTEIVDNVTYDDNITVEVKPIFVISATYYRTSKSFPKHSIVILFNGPKEIANSSLRVSSRSKLERKTKRCIAREGFSPAIICRMNFFVAICPVVKNLRELRISGPDATKMTTIPFREPSERRFDVVTCVSPLFYFERWQILLAFIEVQRYFGASLQSFYVMSMLTTILDIMRAYEQKGWIEVVEWPEISFGDQKLNYTPSHQIEWRNQAAAHTDCLLKYRETASYMMFLDVDDILVPQKAGNYRREFELLMGKTITGLIYPKLYVTVTVSTLSQNFSVEEMLLTAKVDPWLSGFGKSVIIPTYTTTMWLHMPFIKSSRHNESWLSHDTNFIVHPRHYRFKEVARENEHRPLFYNPQTTTIANFELMEATFSRYLFYYKNAFHQMQRNFERFLASSGMRARFAQLNSMPIYYQLFEECYAETIFPNMMSFVMNCVGPHQCHVPSFPTVRCSVLNATYISFSSDNSSVHYAHPKRTTFVVYDNGCQLS